MTQAQIDQFFQENGKKFYQSDLPQIKLLLENVSELRFDDIMNAPFKSPMTMTVIAWLLGGWGVDRFLLGDFVKGMMKLITCGGCGIWTILDIFTAMDRTRKYNYMILQELL
ncbi:MAG: TM2 domain-containing protein [Muribaculaceae bacterium]|nr:TM2 domain-containing protein [Muribaculaceae bacterium]